MYYTKALLVMSLRNPKGYVQPTPIFLLLLLCLAYWVLIVVFFFIFIFCVLNFGGFKEWFSKLVCRSFEGRTEWPENTTSIRGIVVIGGSWGVGGPFDSTSEGMSTYDYGLPSTFLPFDFGLPLPLQPWPKIE